MSMHPYYGPCSELVKEKKTFDMGVVSMAMYLVFWAVALVVEVKLVKKYFSKGCCCQTETKADTTLKELRKKYTNGDISAKEFKRMKADISR